MQNLIDSIHVKGFRSLADVKIDDLPAVAVLIGANGSGKSNFIRFFEMLGWMLGAHRLGEFIQRQGGADDQLFGGSKLSARMDATVAIRTDRGRNDYRFVLTHAHPDRFIFTEEAFRFSSDDRPTEALGNISEVAIRKRRSSKSYNLMNPSTSIQKRHSSLSTCFGVARCINSTTPLTPHISKRSVTWETITIFVHTAAIWLRFCFAWNVKISNDSRGYVTTLVGCCRSLTVSR